MVKIGSNVWAIFLMAGFLLSIMSLGLVNNNNNTANGQTEMTTPKSFIAEIDFDPLFKDLGYTDAQIAELSKDPYFYASLINEYCTQPVPPDPDGVYRLTPRLENSTTTISP